MFEKIMIALALAAFTMSPARTLAAVDEPTQTVQEEVDIGPSSGPHKSNTLSQAVVEKLDAEQLAAVLKHRDTMRRDRARRTPDVPAVAIAVPVATLLAFCFIWGFFLFTRFRKVAEQQATLRLMVEKGVEIPQELLVEAPIKRSDLRRGLLWLGFGLGLIICLAVAVDNAVWGIGLVPTFFGLGHIVAWKFEDTADQDPYTAPANVKAEL